MAEHGFEAATLASVVEESGIPMSSIYHYFGSKDGILLAVLPQARTCEAGREWSGLLAEYVRAERSDLRHGRIA
jgi:AcrR family transcriptional regulator